MEFSKTINIRRIFWLILKLFLTRKNINLSLNLNLECGSDVRGKFYDFLFSYPSNPLLWLKLWHFHRFICDPSCTNPRGSWNMAKRPYSKVAISQKKLIKNLLHANLFHICHTIFKKCHTKYIYKMFSTR